MNKILVFLIITLFITSCNNNGIEGIYYYKKTNSNNSVFTMGRNIGCSLIGQFEFKNGKCYFNVMGADQRVDYEIEDNMIYLGSNSLTNSGVGLTIIDNRNISYMGCLFTKDTQSTQSNNNKDIEKPIKSIDNNQVSTQQKNIEVFKEDKTGISNKNSEQSEGNSEDEKSTKEESI
jgi:hypothetical protein